MEQNEKLNYVLMANEALNLLDTAESKLSELDSLSDFSWDSKCYLEECIRHINTAKDLLIRFKK